MEPVILLHGELTPPRLDQFQRELDLLCPTICSDQSLTIVISSYGGNSQRIFDLMERIQSLQFRTTAKIYRAKSAAAVIALAMTRREIVKTGEFALHLGKIEIETNDLTADNQIPAHIGNTARAFRAKTIELLQKIGVNPGESKWSKLWASNAQDLTPEECLEYGIVDEII